jgi:hypothetical protein
MTAFEDRRLAIASILEGSPAQKLALMLFDALAGLDHQHTSFLSYRSLARLGGVGGDARELLECVAVLVSPRVNVLKPMFVYAPDDATEHVLSKPQWSQAKKMGYLVDPITGDKVENFEDLTFPYFATTADFELIADSK